MHLYRITYRLWNRTTVRMQRTHATAQARTPLGALRAWWRTERQWQNPCVEVVSIDLDHSQCPQVQYPTHWAYTCEQVSPGPHGGHSKEQAPWQSYT